MRRFKPIIKPRVSEVMAEQLKQSIIAGSFKAGSKLPSAHNLAEEFQVSRTAVHEALRFLEGSGFIITRQGQLGGSFVIDLTFESLVKAFQELFIAKSISIEEIYHVKAIVDAEVARLAALNVTPEYAKRLNDAADAERFPVKSWSGDLDRMTAIYFIFAEMCGNRCLEALVRLQISQIRIVVDAIDKESGIPFNFLDSNSACLRPTIDAVMAGDAGVAARSAKEYAAKYANNLTKVEKACFRMKRAMPLTIAANE
ncbi:MAG: FadR family transcriptional regulator [Syntrophus sp. (in: bacteria)]|nr:FadR family transcriptional regulator [Syntrophus sp. (in: bacteria)]